jgi:hypothetical protein
MPEDPRLASGFFEAKKPLRPKVREEAVTRQMKQKVSAEAVTCDGQALKTTLRWIRRFKKDVQAI